MYAKEDIRSYNRSLLYACKGEAIRIDHTNGHVLICEAKNGYFSCTMDRLTDEAPKEEPVILRAPKSQDKDQLNMFGL